METAPKTTNYFDGLNQKLLEAIPADARNVIEFGCANGRLGEAFKRRCSLSIDEFAVALTRDTSHEIEAALGWHLWATDLCVAAARRPPRRCLIVRVRPGTQTGLRSLRCAV